MIAYKILRFTVAVIFLVLPAFSDVPRATTARSPGAPADLQEGTPDVGGTRATYRDVLDRYRKATETDNPAAGNKGSLIYDDALTVRRLRKAAEQGVAVAQTTLGWM